eukprot:m.9197 g.9197  ORF g.9197 m.9197 type:complete len:722 (-) comp5432_c1_seq1:321-2486(-)
MSRLDLQAVESSREYEAILEGHDDWVTCLAVSEAGIASGCTDGTVIIHTPKGEISSIFNVEDGLAVFAVVWAPDMHTLCSGHADGSITLWSTAEEDASRTLRGHSDVVRALAFDEKGKTLASASQDGTVRLWNRSTGQCNTTFDVGTSVLSIAWTPKGEQLIAGTDGGRILLLEPSSSVMNEVATVDGDALCLCWHTKGKHLAIGDSSGQLTIITKNGEEKFRVKAHSDWVTGIGWNRVKQKIVTCGFGDDPTIKVWDERLTIVGSFEGHSAGINAVAWSADGTMLCSASCDTTIRLWKPSTIITEELRQSRKENRHDDSCRCCQWSPDGAAIASGSDDKTLRIWSSDDSTQRLHCFREHGDWVTDLAWSPDSKMIASACGDGIVRVWSLATNKVVHEFRGHSDWVEAVDWSSDGRFVASGAFEHDPTVRIWDIEAGTMAHCCTGHEDRIQSVHIHPDCTFVASGSSDGTVRVFDLSNGKEALCLQTSATNQVRAVQYSHDGMFLASCGNDCLARVWDSTSGELFFTIDVHRKWVYDLAWLHDDSGIITSSEDSSVRVSLLEDFPSDGSGSQKYIAGFQLDSPVFGLSFDSHLGLACSCATGRLVQLNWTQPKKGRRSTLTWAKSFRRTMKVTMGPGFKRGSDTSLLSGASQAPGIDDLTEEDESELDESDVSIVPVGGDDKHVHLVDRTEAEGRILLKHQLIDCTDEAHTAKKSSVCTLV